MAILSSDSFNVLAQSFTVSFKAVAEIFLLGLIGWVAAKRRILTLAVIDALVWLMIDILIPGMLFLAMLRSFDVAKLYNVGAMLGLSVALSGLGIGLAWAATRLWRRPAGVSDVEDRAALAMAGVQNGYYLPLPLVYALMPETLRDETLLYIGACVFVQVILQWTVAVALIAGKRGAGARGGANLNGVAPPRWYFSPPLIGIVAGCLFSLWPLLHEAAMGDLEGWRRWVGIPLGALNLVSSCVGPLAMILLGAILANQPAGRRLPLRSIAIVSAVKLLCVPALALWIGLQMPEAGALFLIALMIEASSPPAINHSIIAVRFGGDAGHVSSVLLAAYVLALLTIPFWLALAGVGAIAK